VFVCVGVLRECGVRVSVSGVLVNTRGERVSPCARVSVCLCVFIRVGRDEKAAVGRDDVLTASPNEHSLGQPRPLTPPMSARKQDDVDE
jgi:hypothetical protein